MGELRRHACAARQDQRIGDDLIEDRAQRGAAPFAPTRQHHDAHQIDHQDQRPEGERDPIGAGRAVKARRRRQQRKPVPPHCALEHAGEGGAVADDEAQGQRRGDHAGEAAQHAEQERACIRDLQRRAGDRREQEGGIKKEIAEPIDRAELLGSHHARGARAPADGDQQKHRDQRSDDPAHRRACSASSAPCSM